MYPLHMTVQPKAELASQTISKEEEVPPSGESSLSKADVHDSELEGALNFALDNISTPSLTIASPRHNPDFHGLFPNLPEVEHLIKKYDCTFQRDSSRGQLFLTKNYACFHANIPGRITNLIIPFDEVTDLEKKMTAVTPSGIRVTTRTAEYIFVYFLSIDTTYYVVHGIWSLSRAAMELASNEAAREPEVGGIEPTPAHNPTQCACGKEGKHFETTIMDIVVPGTPQRIYKLMFASTSKFFIDFMAREQKITDIQASDWHPEAAGLQLFTRNMTYIKPLNVSIGPKQTRCELKDETLLPDSDRYISNLTTTRAPEIVSGSSFAVKTRTCVMWASPVSSRLIVTTTVEWAGKSFIKSIVDKSSIDGQTQYYADLEKSMRLYIAAHRTEFVPDDVAGDIEALEDDINILLVPPGYSTYGIPRPASNEPTRHASEHVSEATDVRQSHLPQQMAFTMHGCLIQHGCTDLAPLIDPLGFSTSAVAEGGFGDIWTGRLHSGGTKLAIKVLRFVSLTGGTKNKELKRITREIYNWSKLDHENIHKLMGVTIFRERLGMVSEWMEHGNLRQYLRQNGDVDRQELCVQIARGVAYLHSVNMVHGDLKACNILISSTGILKITDFDYSIFPECSLAFSTTTRVGGGTLRWMAPELLLEEEPPQRNMKTDIYALGMTLLETITNAHPYSECRDNQIFRKLSREEHPKRSKEYFPDTEHGTRIWAILLQCWDFNPTLRPTADNILESLLAVENQGDNTS